MQPKKARILKKARKGNRGRTVLGEMIANPCEISKIILPLQLAGEEFSEKQLKPISSIFHLRKNRLQKWIGVNIVNFIEFTTTTQTSVELLKIKSRCSFNGDI